MRGVAVELTEYETIMAAEVGIRRQIAALYARLPDRHGFEGDGWEVHFGGAIGELAVAKMFGVYWNGSVNTFRHGGDVGTWQVRLRTRHSYELLIRPNAADDDVYILVTGQPPRLIVRGWLYAWEAKQHPEWLRTHGGRPAAYFVPHDALRDVDTLLP